jgi:hypothetical protein
MAGSAASKGSAVSAAAAKQNTLFHHTPLSRPQETERCYEVWVAKLPLRQWHVRWEPEITVHRSPRFAARATKRSKQVLGA